MDTPSSTRENAVTLPLRRSRVGTSFFGFAGDKAPAHQVELHPDHLIVPAGHLSTRRVEIPLDQVTGLRIVPELARSLLTIEAGARVFNLGFGGRAALQAARSFVTATRDRIGSQPHGDLTLQRIAAREAEVEALVAHRARFAWLVVPLLFAAYFARLGLAEAVFDLDYFGASARAWLAAGELYRLVTAAWLHANLWHIGGNLVAIVWLGYAVERALGVSRLILIMTAATLGSALGSTWLTFGHTIGASGVGMGLAAGFAVVAIMYRRELPRPIARPAWWWMVFVLLLAPSPDGPGPSAIDHAAHAGGAFGGALAAYVLCARRPLSRLRRPDLRWLAGLAVLLHVAALGMMSYRVVVTSPLGELQRLTALVREKRLSAHEANAIAWGFAIKKNVEPNLLQAALQLADAALQVAPRDIGLADTVATLHHRTGSDRRAAELEARTLDDVAEAFDATGFATQLARFLAAAPPVQSGITIEASDRQVRVAFADSALGLAESGVTIYAVALRHGRIEGLIRLRLGAGQRERYVKVPAPTDSIWNAMSTPIAPDADYGIMLVRSGCGCKDGSSMLNVWAVNPEVLGWP